MSILFAENDEQADPVGISDEGPELQPAYAGFLFFWAALVASAGITTLGLWKLIELLM